MLIDREQLIDLLAERTGEDRAHMAQQLTELITKIDAITKDGKKYTIQRFGTFYREEGELCFFPSQELATEINYKYIGMKPIELMEPYKKTETSPNEPEEKIEDARTPRRSEVEGIWEDQSTAWDEGEMGDAGGEESRSEDETEPDMGSEPGEAEWTELPRKPELPDLSEFEQQPSQSKSRRIPQTPEEWKSELEARKERPKQQDKADKEEKPERQKADPEALIHPFGNIPDPDMLSGPSREEDDERETRVSASEDTDDVEEQYAETTGEGVEQEEPEDYREIFGFTESSREEEDIHESWGKEAESYEESFQEEIEDEIDELEEIIEPGSAYGEYEEEEDEYEELVFGEASFYEEDDDESDRSGRMVDEEDEDRDTVSPFAIWGVILALLIIAFFGWLMYEMEFLGDETEPVADESSVEQPVEQQPTEPAAETEETALYGLHGTVREGANNGYTIVIYSLRNGPNAKNVQRRLKNDDYRVLLKKQFTPRGDAFWRVSLGQFETVSEARQAARNLPADLKNDFIVQRI